MEPDGECGGLDGGKDARILRGNRSGAEGDDVGERSISLVNLTRPGPDSNPGGRSISRVNLTNTAGDGDGVDGEGEGAENEGDDSKDFPKKRGSILHSAFFDPSGAGGGGVGGDQSIGLNEHSRNPGSLSA